MARGFGTFGVGSTDKIATTYTVGSTGQRTYHVWFNQNSNGGGGLGRIFDKSDTTATHEAINVGTTFTFAVRWSSVQGQWTFTGGSGTGVWQCITVTYDASSTANDPVCYINGASVAVSEATSPSGTLVSNATPFYIGNRIVDSARNFDGRIAEFAIWDGVFLTQDEITALAKGYSPLLIRSGRLVEYVPMLRENVSRTRAAPTITGTAVQPHPRIIMARGFNRMGRFTAGVVVALAYLRPDADDSISDWTDQSGGTATLYAAIDETPASDTDYIKSPSPPNTSVARFRMSDPITGKTLVDPVVVSYRFKKTSEADQKLDVTLKQSSTTIATWQHTGAGLTTSFQTAAQTLTSPQLASITNFNDLYIEFQASPP